MPTTDAPIPRARREGLRAAWILVLSLVALIPLAVWNATREPDTPAEIVEAFLEAVRDKDLDRAFSYLDSPVPGGHEAAFLHPDAISDEWEVLSVHTVEHEMYSPAQVRVVIGLPEGKADGTFTVRDHEGELGIVDPFRTVSIDSSPHLSLRVNDRVLDLDPASIQSGPHALSGESYQLLPGAYRFFGGEPVVMMPDGEQSVDTVRVTPPVPEPTAAQLASAQTAVEELIDSCVEYRTPNPTGCPFGTDGRVDTVDQQRMKSVEEVAWTVTEYPVIDLVVGTDYYNQPSLRVVFLEPGRLELEGRGSPDYDNWLEFSAVCGFGGENLSVMFDRDGEALVVAGDLESGDTCRGTE